jgi:hypothetical protein
MFIIYGKQGLSNMVIQVKSKFAAMVLAYKQEEYIEYCLKAAYPFFYKFVVMYSEKPFNEYNPNSRKMFKEKDKTLSIIKNFPDPENKFILKKGIWSNEEEMRNEALDLMRGAGADYCFILDADEFYPDKLFPSMLRFIEKNVPVNEVAWAKHKTPFKRMDYLIKTKKARLPIAVKITPLVRFVQQRQPSGEKYKLPDRFFYWHLGYVLPDKRMYEKVNTYSHAKDLPGNWFTEKWLNWTPKTTNLCRKDPARWSKTVKFDAKKLPLVLHDHPFFPK